MNRLKKKSTTEQVSFTTPSWTVFREDHRSNMFSNEDIREIHSLIPPEKDPQALDAFPPLLLSASGHGFVTARHAQDELERRVSAESERIAVTTLGHELDLGDEVVLQLVEASPSVAALSSDQRYIITSNERNALASRLEQLVETQIVSKTTFSKENDITVASIDDLLLSLNINGTEQNGLIRDNFVVGQIYQQKVSAFVAEQIENSLKTSESVEFTPSTLPGQPPTWFVKQVVYNELKIKELETQFHVEEKEDGIRCTPNTSIVRKRDGEIEQLRIGGLPYVDLPVFAKEFPQLYESLEDAESHLQSVSGISLLGYTALSESWLQKLVEECTSALEILGFADLKSQIEATLPKPAQGEVRDRLERQTKATYKERAGRELQNAGSFLITAERYASEKDILLASMKAHATHHWQKYKDTPDKDLKFQIANTFAFIPESQPVLQAVSTDKDLEKSAEEQYWGVISDLESQNEVEFSTFWIEKVTSRISNYEQGLNAIQDAKLKEQLSEVLANFVSKELLPDTIIKARAQSLILSRKTKKTVSKLESSIKAGKDLASLLVSLDKFNKKHGLEGDEKSVAVSKIGLVSEFTRKMQKQSDGPVLFLTLVVVLFARHNPGLIYATGKFAPKLLKQLKSSLEAEQYQQLERWKDMTKAGSLSAEDKKEMKRFAVGES